MRPAGLRPLTRTLKVSQRIGYLLFILFEATLGCFLLTGHVASLVKRRLDFPPGKTITRIGLLPFHYAYRTHGKSAEQYLRIPGNGTDLEITLQDYQFLHAHPQPGQNATDPDHIHSDHAFCDRLTIEQTGKAVRVLHAGSRELPTGTVMLRPALPPPPSR